MRVHRVSLNRTEGSSSSSAPLREDAAATMCPCCKYAWHADCAHAVMTALFSDVGVEHSDMPDRDCLLELVGAERCNIVDTGGDTGIGGWHNQEHAPKLINPVPGLGGFAIR